VPRLAFINYAMFIAEWTADFYTGVGHFDIYEINASGRKDGVPIAALGNLTCKGY
jgi:hypothetical protein